jgi:hypothetical protein
MPLVQSLFGILEDYFWVVVAALYGALIFFVLKANLYCTQNQYKRQQMSLYIYILNGIHSLRCSVWY